MAGRTSLAQHQGLVMGVITALISVYSTLVGMWVLAGPAETRALLADADILFRAVPWCKVACFCAAIMAVYAAALACPLKACAAAMTSAFQAVCQEVYHAARSWVCNLVQVAQCKASAMCTVESWIELFQDSMGFLAYHVLSTVIKLADGCRTSLMPIKCTMSAVHKLVGVVVHALDWIDTALAKVSHGAVTLLFGEQHTKPVHKDCIPAEPTASDDDAVSDSSEAASVTAVVTPTRMSLEHDGGLTGRSSTSDSGSFSESP